MGLAEMTEPTSPMDRARIAEARNARFTFELLADLLSDLTLPLARSHTTTALVQQHLYRETVNARHGGMYRHLCDIFPSGDFDGISPWLNTLYFPKQGIILCRIPKNATNTILMALYRRELPRIASVLTSVTKVNSEFGYELINRLSDSFIIPDLNLLTDPTKRKLAFIRDPMDRLASGIQNKFIETIVPSAKKAEPEGLVHEMLVQYGRLFSEPVQLQQFSLVKLAKLLGQLPKDTLDPHFSPQSAFLPSFDAFELYSVDTVDTVLGGSAGQRQRAMNRSAVGQGAGSGGRRYVLSDDLANTPFASWDEPLLQEWRDTVLKSRGMALRAMFGDLYRGDWALIERIAQGRSMPVGV